jgi:hypothetical protein
MGNIVLKKRPYIYTTYDNGPYKSVRKKDQTLPPAQTERLLYMSWVAGDEIFETCGQKKCSATHAKDFGKKKFAKSHNNLREKNLKLPYPEKQAPI